MSLVKNLRQMLTQSFLSLPLLLVGWISFMGLTQGNIALLILALGHIFIVPLSTMLSNTLVEALAKLLEKIPSVGDGTVSRFFTVANVDNCNLIPGSIERVVPFIWVAPSYWVAHISFFAVFLLTNASFISNMPAAEGADKDKVNRRQTQVAISALLTTVVFGVLIVMRYFLTGCETVGGIALGTLLMGSLGYACYMVVKQCSVKDSDVFGIIQSVLPEAMKDEPPMTCVFRG